MAKTKFLIYLTEDEKRRLEEIIENEPEKTAMRAKILLASDFNNPTYLPVQKIEEELGVSHTTIQRVRSEYANLGLDGAIYPKGTLSYDRRALMTDEKRAQILEMLKERPPYGYRRWTIRNICDECVNRGIFDYVATSAIQKFLHREGIDLSNLNRE